MGKKKKRKVGGKRSGERRQWHLVPLDALIVALETRPDALMHAVVEDSLCANAETAAILVASTIHHYEQDVEAGAPSQRHTLLDSVAAVFEHGAVKYGEGTWADVGRGKMSFRREYVSAICRHMWPLDGMIDEKPEGSGQSHGAHAVANALIVLWHETRWSK